MYTYIIKNTCMYMYMLNMNQYTTTYTYTITCIVLLHINKCFIVTRV